MKKLLFILLFIPVLCFGQLNINNNTVKISATGDITYNFMHGIGSADSTVTYSIGGTQNVYYRISPTMTIRESDGVTLVADSATIVTAGDYEVWCWVAATTSNANDLIRFKIYKNNSAMPTSIGRFIVSSNGSGVYSTNSYMWYMLSLSVGDRISWRVANISGARAVTIADFKIYIKKVPE